MANSDGKIPAQAGQRISENSTKRTDGRMSSSLKRIASGNVQTAAQDEKNEGRASIAELYRERPRRIGR